MNSASILLAIGAQSNCYCFEVAVNALPTFHNFTPKIISIASECGWKLQIKLTFIEIIISNFIYEKENSHFICTNSQYNRAPSLYTYQMLEI